MDRPKPDPAQRPARKLYNLQGEEDVIRVLLIEDAWPDGHPFFVGPRDPTESKIQHGAETRWIIHNRMGSHLSECRYSSWLTQEACEWAKGGVIAVNQQDGDLEPIWRRDGWRDMLNKAMRYSGYTPIVCAAGNGGFDTGIWREFATPCIVVGANTDDGPRAVRADYSNYGTRIDVWRSGATEGVALKRKGHGTSWAMPKVAADVALLIKQFGWRSSSDMRDLWRKHKTYQAVADHLSGFPREIDYDNDGHIGFSDYLRFIGKFGKRRKEYL